jgi:gluconate 2-dehydrogenase alpha chain
MAIEKTDVVIVGMGAAGGILAAELSKAGMRVIGLERGPRLATKDFAAQDELRYFQRQDLRPDPKRQPITWRPNPNTGATPLQILNYGNQAGGGTVHYGSVSWRFHEDDFRVRSHTIERYGASAIPEDSSLIDWPLSYADLEPYYDRAEYELGVSGKAGNLQGNKIDGGNIFEAPRRRDYPLPPLQVDQSGANFEAGTRKLGCHPFSTPRAIVSQPYNGRPGCSYCGFCQAFGCHIGAKSSILVTKLPEADATGNFKLITGGMCYRVNSDNSGRATGISYYGPDRSDNTIEAELVILAPFIYDNVRLLLLSKTEKFPDGLANSSGHLGKHLMADIVRSRRARRRPDRHGHGHESTARRSALGRQIPRLLRPVLYAPHRAHRPDREPALSGSNDRSRPGCARRLGPAGAAADLRLAAPQRTGAGRIHPEQARRDRPRHGRLSGLDRAVRSRRSGRASRGRHPHGQQPEGVRR